MSQGHDDWQRQQGLSDDNCRGGVEQVQRSQRATAGQQAEAQQAQEDCRDSQRGPEHHQQQAVAEKVAASQARGNWQPDQDRQGDGGQRNAQRAERGIEDLPIAAGDQPDGFFQTVEQEVHQGVSRGCG